MFKNDKIATYLGFCLKSNKLLFGLDKLTQTKNKIHLVLYCTTISKNSYEKLINLCELRNWTMLNIENLSEKVYKQNCKVVGICNLELARAIKTESSTKRED